MNTILTSIEILSHVVADALEKVGIHSDYAEHIAWHEVNTNPRIKVWSEWFNKNCLSCQNSPTDCKFFVPPAASQNQSIIVKRGNMMEVERGQKYCPHFCQAYASGS